VVSALFVETGEARSAAADVLSTAPVRRLPSGSSHRVGHFDGVSFLVVEEGFIVIRRESTGRPGLVICFAGAGALVPAPVPGETLDALVEARLTLVSEVMYAALLTRPAVATVLSDALRLSLRQKQETIASFGSTHPDERVQRKLLQLAREYGHVAVDGIRVDFPITHELLAAMTGAARETVSRAIRRLERSGFLARDGRSYRLRVDPEAVLMP
jgi:hypothetical protein